MKIIEKVWDSIEDYKYTAIELGEDDDGNEIEFEYTDWTVDAGEIRRDLFPILIEIYGRNPF